MANLGPRKLGAFAQGLYEQSATQKEALDTVMTLIDGRTFAYSQAGAVALAAGKLTSSAVVDTNAVNIAVNTAVAGDTSLTVTFGGAVTADFFKDGYLWTNDDTGEGQFMGVKTHAAGTADVVIYLKDPVRVNFAADTTVSLSVNRQKLVLIAATTLDNIPAGVPPIAVTANYYFWNQVKGPCPVLTAGTVVKGNAVGPLTTAGAIAPAATNDVIGHLGTVLCVNATTEYSLINLAIPGY